MTPGVPRGWGFKRDPMVSRPGVFFIRHKGWGLFWERVRIDCSPTSRSRRRDQPVPRAALPAHLAAPRRILCEALPGRRMAPVGCTRCHPRSARSARRGRSSPPDARCHTLTRRGVVPHQAEHGAWFQVFFLDGSRYWVMIHQSFCRCRGLWISYTKPDIHSQSP